jgi:hypothetical protein
MQAGRKQGSTSFLKKRSKKLLFPSPYRATGAGIKSLLVLFFRKERLALPA